MTETWQGKAHRIIGKLSLRAYKQANPKPNRQAKAYGIPQLAADLVDCLNRNDEVGAKLLFLSYDDLKAIEK